MAQAQEKTKRQFLRKPTGRPPMAEEVKRLVWELYCKNTRTLSEIATACRISRATVSKIVREFKAVEHG